ncbi:hypothetical protein RJ641_003442 [Dillenia turbinata]|uniref:DUF7734 domain-containing protein n=1 Tax=Dillenia turbinata TaxID=194707 RepID=A0AAN8Z9E8_9MAGN
MLKYRGGQSVTPPSSLPKFPLLSNYRVLQHHHNHNIVGFCCFPRKSLRLSTQEGCSCRSDLSCCARRGIRYDCEDNEDDAEYRHNVELAMLEFYSQSARGEALLVQAVVDDEDVEVLIFRGFSSCLSYGTSPDPSKSILPARAVIKSIDRIKGPFDPSNIEYLEKGLTVEAFKSRIQTN